MLTATVQPRIASRFRVTKNAEGLGQLAQDIDDFLFRLAFHNPKKMAALQIEAHEKWVPTLRILEKHADSLLDADLVRVFVELQEAMTVFSQYAIRGFEDVVRLKLQVDAANVLLKKTIFAREYKGEIFEEGDEAFYLPPDKPKPRQAMLVVLHGAFMKGRNFIWKWVFAAARRRLAVYAPSSHGATWAAEDFEPVELMIEKLGENYGLPKEETLLAGLSDGAIAATLLGCRKRVPFRKLALLAGTKPFDMEAMPRIPLYIVHGTADPIFPIGPARETVEKLRARTKGITYRELADAPHSFPYPEIDPLMDWFVT